MKWVKASERLPVFKKLYCGKLKGKPALVSDWNLRKGWMSANNNLERIEDVEWLDESPSSPSSEGWVKCDRPPENTNLVILFWYGEEEFEFGRYVEGKYQDSASGMNYMSPPDLWTKVSNPPSQNKEA